MVQADVAKTGEAFRRPTVGLALGSGALRGLAHLGVLQAFLDHRVPIDLIAGSSIGALVGAVFSAGADPRWAMKLAAGLSWEHLIEVAMPRYGFVRGDRLLSMARVLTKNKTFADLCTPLTCVAVDLEKGAEVCLSEGNVAEAVRASCSIPGVFAPYRLDGRLLVDGGVLTRVPVEPLRRRGADVVVAIDVASPVVEEVRITNLMSIILRAIDIMEKEVFKSRSGRADVWIRPDLSGLSDTDLGQAPAYFERGREAMEAAIPAVLELIGAGGAGAGVAGADATGTA